MPKTLTADQMDHRDEACMELQNRASIDSNFVKSIVMGDGTLVCGYEPETKVRSSQWKTATSPRPENMFRSDQTLKQLPLCYWIFTVKSDKSS